MFNGNDLPHELLLTRRQKTKIRNAFNNNTSTDLKRSKTQIDKIIQSEEFLSRLLGPLLKTGLPLIKNVIKPLAKRTTDWYDKNKFNKILTTIDNNNFNDKNRIGKLKFNDISNLINNIRNNTISEVDTENEINELNEIKKGRNKR